jgi:hypothetical protein
MTNHFTDTSSVLRLYGLFIVIHSFVKSLRTVLVAFYRE